MHKIPLGLKSIMDKNQQKEVVDLLQSKLKDTRLAEVKTNIISLIVNRLLAGTTVLRGAAFVFDDVVMATRRFKGGMLVIEIYDMQGKSYCGYVEKKIT